jgi:hypothetical protein
VLRWYRKKVIGMRLIDADVLIDHLCEVMKTANHFGNTERVSEIGGCIGVIKGEKTIERPHGEWEHWGSPFTDDTIANSIVCTRCKARYVEIDGEVFNFCPNCGASMRKEGESN